jgi:hypothetical protein
VLTLAVLIGTVGNKLHNALSGGLWDEVSRSFVVSFSDDSYTSTFFFFLQQSHTSGISQYDTMVSYGLAGGIRATEQNVSLVGFAVDKLTLETLATPQ